MERPSFSAQKFSAWDLRFNRNTYYCEEDSLRVVIKSLNSSSEDFVDYHDIGERVTKERKRILILLAFGSLLSIWGLIIGMAKISGSDNGKYGHFAGTFYLVTGLVILLFYVLLSRHYWFLSDPRTGASIPFPVMPFRKKKLKATMDAILEVKRERMLNLYGFYDEEKSLGQHKQHLKWLLEKKYINEADYQVRLEFIQSKFESEDREIGFKRNSEEEEDEL